MKLIIDTTERKLTTQTEAESQVIDLYSKEAFELISREWLKVGWNQKYSYTFSWLGRPIVQLPEDMIRVQEVIYRLRPDVIIETGVAHGGSLIYYASLCQIMEQGRVIGIDIEIRPHNRQAIEAHEMSPLITLIEGNAASPEVVQRVHSMVKSGESVLVILDSNHSKQHVTNELREYCDLVSPGSYLVATDGLMKDLYDVPNGKAEWVGDNPVAAVVEFIASHPEFVWEQPAWSFNESRLTKNVTHWPGAWLRRKTPS
jgi:cephalosporin hydroxylase